MGVLALVAALTLLHGVVTIGPTTPVCRAGVPCDRPASHVQLVFTRLGRSTSTTTDGSGTFRIKLRPGIYAVRANAGTSLRPHAINVRAPSTRLDFAIDTGIR